MALTPDCRVPGLEINTSGMQEYGRDQLDCFRWWTLDELRGSTEQILPGLLERMFAEDGPDEPVQMSWDR
ncbi:hypothetical protein ABT120_37060 [Nonomuraea angiospora]|uniref:hypothetical protein n=1 Tax=Nonomuraea angiospora TaxID=46172 RepID=UPI00331AA05B